MYNLGFILLVLMYNERFILLVQLIMYTNNYPRLQDTSILAKQIYNEWVSLFFSINK